jgi:hypothetical protein
MLYFETLYKTNDLRDFPEGEYFQLKSNQRS